MLYLRSKQKAYQKIPLAKKRAFKTGAGTQRKPELGTAIEKNCFKIRIAIASKGKGKSGGARVIAILLLRKLLFS